MSTDKVVPEYIWQAVMKYIAPDGIPAEGNVPAITAFSGGYPDGIIESPLTMQWDITFSPAQEDEWSLVLLAAHLFNTYEPRVGHVTATSLLTDLSTIKAYMDSPDADANTMRDTIAALLRLFLT